MNYFKYILALCLFSLFLSCEEKIDIDLKFSEPRLVIDASLEAMQSCYVKLSMTQDYWDREDAEGISGAIITISDDEGNSEVLQELSGNGTYVSKMIGSVGTIYTLSVEVDGEIYVARELLHPAVPIESMRTHKIDSGGDVYYYPRIYYIDPKGVDNYYYYSLEINGRKMQGARFRDDKRSDGLPMEPILFFDDEENDDEELKVGDNVLVEMQAIGKGAYTFYKSISSPGGMPNSNPISNFSGDVLGMFKTYNTSYIEKTITEEDFY